MMMNRKNDAVAAALLSKRLIEFKGNSCTHRSDVIRFLIPLFELGFRFFHCCTPFHSHTAPATVVKEACSNHKSLPHRHGSRFGKITNLHDALNLFDKMTHNTQTLPSVIEFNQLLDAVAKMKQYSPSISLFKQMCALGVPVDVYTINIVIRCCCHLHRTSDGFPILGGCFKRGIVPDVVTFSTLLNGLINQDSILEAETFFKKLIRERLCEPNVVMYNTMIKGLCKFGNNDTAIAMLTLMDERGCKPNVVTYNIIIDSFCKDQKMGEALNLFKVMLFNEMKADGQIPNSITYRIILEGLCNNGEVDEALALFSSMGDSTLNSDIYVYNILIEGTSKGGKLDIARVLFNEITSKGIQLDVRTYTVMINGFCKEGLVHEAKELFMEMEESGCPPNSVTYRIMLQGYVKNRVS